MQPKLLRLGIFAIQKTVKASKEDFKLNNIVGKTFGLGVCSFLSQISLVAAMGKAVEFTALSMVREIVFGVGVALVFPVFFGLDGVLYSMPVSELLTAVLSAIVIVRTYGELEKTLKKFKKRVDN